MSLLYPRRSAEDQAVSAQKTVPTVLITGANRGIGLAFSKQYAEKNWRVIATARKPEKAEDLKKLAARHSNVIIEQLDVTSDKQVAALAAKYKGQPIDVLLNNAGYFGSTESQQFGQFDFALLDTIMDVNAAGPLRMAQAFVSNVELSQQKKVVTIGSGLGSMTIASGMPRHYFYKMSKVAMAMSMASLRSELSRQGVIVAMLSPGQVDTRMLRSSGFRGKALSTTESVSSMIKLIESLTADMPATVINYNGERLPW